MVKEGRGLIRVNGKPIGLVEPSVLRMKVYEPVSVDLSIAGGRGWRMQSGQGRAMDSNGKSRTSNSMPALWTKQEDRRRRWQ